MNIYFPLVCILTLFFSACGPSSTHDYQAQARCKMNQLRYDLEKIEDTTDLLKSKERLKKDFNRLTKVIIHYQNYQKKHPNQIYEVSDNLQRSAGLLKIEFERIYEMEGGLDVIVDAQKDAFLQLSLFEQS